MKVQSLGSGSRGNAWLFEAGGSCVLVDCGFPPRTLARKLAQAGVSPDAVDAVLVTHEHDDHVRGLAAAAAKWHWPVFAHPASARRLAPLPQGTRRWDAATPAILGGLVVEAVPVPHDAAAAQALVVTDRASGWRSGLAHDLGTVPDALTAAFAGLDLLVLEANHDAGMLRAGPYPAWLQARIAGDRGHLSNAQAAALARAVGHRGLRTVVLAHLSDENNTAALAEAAVRGALSGTGFRGRVTAARQRVVGEALGEPRRSAQYALAL